MENVEKSLMEASPSFKQSVDDNKAELAKVKS
jgi:hypothetical protein